MKKKRVPPLVFLMAVLGGVVPVSAEKSLATTSPIDPLYRDVEAGMYFEEIPPTTGPADQTEPTYSKLPDLVALGWLFDGNRSSNSCTPHCFMQTARPDVEKFLRLSGICMGEDCIDCTAGRRLAKKCSA